MPPRGSRSWGAWLASRTERERKEVLDGLPDDVLRALPYMFEMWGAAHQLPPAGDWRSWVVMGGRGAGKTRAGAEWVRSVVEGPRPVDAGACRRVALVGETYEQARDVMVFGESGILACSPPDRRPDWISGTRTLRWANGAEARAFSASDPEAMRGPQFDAAWCDELAKWRKGRDPWDMLQFALRLGDAPRACVTTTPKAAPVLTELLGRASTVVTRAATEANRAWLAESFLAEVRARYAGTRLERQELDGELLEDVEGALWPVGIIEAGRLARPEEMDRIVVAVDPPVTGRASSDACGIVVCGLLRAPDPRDWQAVVLEDASVTGASPAAWAAAAVEAGRRWNADRIVAEVNNGGDLVESVIRQVDPAASYKAVHASRGKVARAEPVAALYERGRVRHAGVFAELEAEMGAMTAGGYRGAGSPDRVDALVWAVTELLIAGAPRGVPRLRLL